MIAADPEQALNPDVAPERTQTIPSATGSAAAAAAAKLREEILSGTEPGTFLGSEDDLLARLGVSRPTLRQAARILEQEDLLTVRRGKKGGLFARRPTSDTLAHVASVVLRAQGATLEDLTRVNALVGAEAARLAAEHAPEHDRRSLHELALEQLGDESPGAPGAPLGESPRDSGGSGDSGDVDDTGDAGEVNDTGEVSDTENTADVAATDEAENTTDVADMNDAGNAGDVPDDIASDAAGEAAGGRAVLDTVLEVNRRLAALSGSPTLAMFGSVLAELAHANAEARMFTDPERLASMRDYVRALTAAVANSNGDEAAELVERHHDRLLRWMRQPSP